MTKPKNPDAFLGVSAPKQKQSHVLELPDPHSWEQKVMMQAFVTPGLIELFAACGTKFGKAQPLQEVTPTPNGYVMFGDLKEGDLVFDENGKPTEITYITPTMHNHDCYEVVFQDGQTVKCDAEHLWFTKTHADRKNEARSKDPNKKYGSVKTTLDILKTVEVQVGAATRPNHSISLVTAPLEFPKKRLNIDPYLLGLWLGDGDSANPYLTLNESQSKCIIAKLTSLGIEVVPLSGKLRHKVVGLKADLANADLLQNKHIPETYLTASPKQRLELLRGLLDTDGTVSKRGDCCFDNTNKNIAMGFMRLAMSLGIKCKFHQRQGRFEGVDKKICYRVMFTTDIPVFSVAEKLQRLRPVTAKSRNRYIVAVNKIPSEPVRCISVASPRSLYLTGYACIPTHNTLGASGGMAAGAWIRQKGVYRWVAPIYSQAKYGLRYHESIIPKGTYNLNRSEPSVTMKNNDTRIEYRSGKNPEELEGEGVTGGYALDEAAKMTRQVYDSAKTTVTLTRAPICAFSTPKGKNWFFQKSMEAKESMEWHLARGKAPPKIFLTAPTSANPNVPEESLIDFKKSLPERLYRQYVLAEFVDDGSVFAGYRECVEGTDTIDLFGYIQQWVHPDCCDAKVVIGVDWAKKDDFTVMTAIDIEGSTARMVGFVRFQGQPYIEAVKILMRFARNFGEIQIVLHDRTGVGEAIDDILAGTGLPCEGVVFTNTSKTSMVNQLMLTFERGDISIPHIKVLLGELEMYEVSTTSTGLCKYSAPDGFHDDCVSSLMLANRAAQELRSGFEIRLLEDLPNTKLSIDKFYNELAEEAEDDLYD